MRTTRTIRVASISLFVILVSVSWLLFFKLWGGVELSSILSSVTGRAPLACTYRCLGIIPFLPFLIESARLLLLVFLAFALLAAVIKTAKSIRKTKKYISSVEKRIIQGASLFPDLNPVRIFRDPSPLAFTAGFLNPKIYLSATLCETFEKSELRAVVLHESQHQKTKDPLKFLLISFLADFLFFIPISNFLKRSLRLAAEIKADSHCLSHKVDVLELAGALLRVQKRHSLTVSWFYDQNHERIKVLLGQPVKFAPALKRVVISLVLITVLFFFSFVPIKKGSAAAVLNHEKSCVVHRLHS